MDTVPPEISKRPFLRSHKVLYLFFFLISVFILGYYLFSAPTASISTINRQGVTIHISSNESLGAIAEDLETKKVVRQAGALKVFVSLFGASKGIQKGDYFFEEKVSVFRVAWMLARGIHNVDPIKVTFKEGITNEEMATILSTKLASFRRDLFLSDEKSKQGYLFPDTYFFFSLTTSDEIIKELSDNFNKRIFPLKADIAKSDHSLSDIIKMASIIQNEARGESDAPLISGILWKRIKNGMPLQVDVSRETYERTGLPSSPISNPGIVAIRATLAPKDSPYLYYLHDRDGMIHFARTYEEHKSNINKYLK